MYIEPFEYYQTYCESITKGLATVRRVKYEEAYHLLNEAGQFGSRIFVCGNGGSASIAEHFSCDHSKGVRGDTHLRPNVVSLSSNMATITAIGNDLGFDQIFSKQVEFSNANHTDVLVAISSSGNSPNILRALEYANQVKMHSIAIVGFDGGGARDLADVVLHVNSSNYGVVEDCHQILMHSLAQALRVKNSTDHIKL